MAENKLQRLGYLIDTNIFIKIEKDSLNQGFWKNLPEGIEMGISVITASELLHGVHRAVDEQERLKRSAFVEQILNQIPTYPIDLKVSRQYAQLMSYFSSKKIAIEAHDLLIGATAVAVNFGVITYNAKDFLRIPGLEVYTPS